VFCPIFTDITGELGFLVFNDNDVYHGNWIVRNNGLNATIPSPEKRQRACIAKPIVIYTLYLISIHVIEI